MTPAASAIDNAVDRGIDRIGVGAATWVVTGTALAVPLLAMGLWRPVVALPVLLVALAVAVRMAGTVPGVDGPRWAALSLAAVAVAGGVWAGATHAEHVVLRRDAGTYALYAQHIATAHTIRVDADVPAVGGPAALALPGVTVGSPGFFDQGRGTDTHLVPQFLPATPVALSVGWWAGGWTGLLLVPALALTFALLAFGALARRLVGPRWAVLATGALALTQPVLHAGRSTYSEPFALLVGCAAMTLLVAASGRRTAFVAGLLFGGVALVRIDGLRESALLLPVIAVLVARRSPLARPLLAGLGASTAGALAAAALISRPYLGAIAGSLLPLLALVVLLGGGSLAALRLRRWPTSLVRRLPLALGGATLLGFAVLASRPLWLVVRQSPTDPGARVVAGLQLAQGLAVDGGRTYDEASIGWVAWWVGVPALLLALGAAVGLAVRLGVVLRDGLSLPPWLAPAVVGVASTALTLYRPGITPDHPWADRRLVPVVLPVVLLLATAALASLGATLSPVRRHRVTPVVGLGALLLVVPAGLATWPVAGQRTERGEVAAVARACAAFGPRDTAVLVDSRAANEWPQVLRGVCGVPSVVVRARSGSPDVGAVRAVVAAVGATGRQAVLVAAQGPQPLRELGASPRQVVRLSTVEDQRLLTRRPAGDAALAIDLWLGPVSSAPP